MTFTASIARARLLEEQLAQASPDLLRELPITLVNTLMSAEDDVVCSAAYGTVFEERVTRHNVYRTREFDIRAGTIALAIPKPRQGSYFPEWLLERRKRAERSTSIEIRVTTAERNALIDVCQPRDEKARLFVTFVEWTVGRRALAAVGRCAQRVKDR